ncbi:MAG: thiamine phosphate synthase [Andreesenia angusta]|nr:thiamine phosphate synthase [Andreesenia angusta]
MNTQTMRISKEDLLLYAITSRNWLNGETLESQVKEAIEGGITILQLREKDMKYDQFLEEARKIKAVCKDRIPFIINDNIEIAKEVDADGIHIGQSDINIKEARKILGEDKIIGVSAHTIEQAIEAEENNADYLGVGSVFPTDTKDDAENINIDILKDIVQKVNIPIVAIGGINRENIYELKGVEIAGIASISAIFSNEDIKVKTEELKEILDKEIIND